MESHRYSYAMYLKFSLSGTVGLLKIVNVRCQDETWI